MAMAVTMGSNSFVLATSCEIKNMLTKFAAAREPKQGFQQALPALARSAAAVYFINCLLPIYFAWTSDAFPFHATTCQTPDSKCLERRRDGMNVSCIATGLTQFANSAARSLGFVVGGGLLLCCEI